MDAKNHRPRWRSVATALALCVASVMAVLVVAEPAHARCNGVGSSITMSLPVGASNSVGQERAGATLLNGEVVTPGESCNGDGVYYGTLADTELDGLGVHLDVCDDSNGPCLDPPLYIGGNGQRLYFRIPEGDGSLYFRIRVGNLSAARTFSGF